MKKLVVFISLFILFGISVNAYATNGVYLIGVGPASRAMGGTGVAAPQDTTAALSTNPAAIASFKGTQFDIGATYFIPNQKAKVTWSAVGYPDWSGSSQDSPYAVPAIGLITPISKDLTFGLGFLGIAGLGVDYVNIGPLGGNNVRTMMIVLGLTPTVAYKMGPLALGASILGNFQLADFGEGVTHDIAWGARLGVHYDLNMISLGLSYTTEQSATHERIFNLVGDSNKENLKIGLPQQFAFGVGIKPIPKLLIEADVKWLNWENADLFKDVDWKNQWVYALGLQYKVTSDLALRAGFNYGKNPVEIHNDFNVSGTTNLQGNTISTFTYEYLRIIGLPAITETAYTLGLGYNLSKNVALNLGYKYVPKKTITESTMGGAIVFESSLSETAFDVGLSVKF